MFRKKKVHQKIPSFRRISLTVLIISSSESFNLYFLGWSRDSNKLVQSSRSRKIPAKICWSEDCIFKSTSFQLRIHRTKSDRTSSYSESDWESVFEWPFSGSKKIKKFRKKNPKISKKKIRKFRKKNLKFSKISQFYIYNFIKK